MDNFRVVLCQASYSMGAILIHLEPPILSSSDSIIMLKSSAGIPVARGRSALFIASHYKVDLSLLLEYP